MNDEPEPQPDNPEDPHEAYEEIQSVEPPQFGFFDRLYRSCSDLNFYGLVAVEGKKQAAYYCFKLCLLVGLITGLSFGLESWTIVGDVSRDLQGKIPTVRIQNGDLNVDADTPHRLSLRNDYVLILDPEAELNRLRLEPDVLLVLVNGALHIRNGERSFETWTFSQLGVPKSEESIVINSDTVANWTSFFQWIVLTLAVLGLMIGYVIQGGLRVFLISAGGLFAREQDSPLFPWGRLLKLSAYALTPILLLDGLLFVVGWNLPYQEMLLLGGGTIFVYYIVRHLSDRLRQVRIEVTPDSDESGQSDDTGHF